MGNSGLKQHIETAEKTGAFKLSSKSLTEFPRDLSKLSHVLRNLDLSTNKLASVPPVIGQFQQLKHLFLNENRLASLPEELSQLSKLETIAASGNRLTKIPLSYQKLSHLKNVHLNQNQLNEFPLAFCSLKHLDLLDISQNQIRLIPDEVQTLSVTELNLNQNQVSVLSSGLAKCPRLRTLRLEENCLNLDSIPESLFTESQISTLSVDGNLFSIKEFQNLAGHEKYMERYTATRKKMY